MGFAPMYLLFSVALLQFHSYICGNHNLECKSGKRATSLPFHQLARHSKVTRFTNRNQHLHSNGWALEHGQHVPVPLSAIAMSSVATQTACGWAPPLLINSAPPTGARPGRVESEIQPVPTLEPIFQGSNRVNIRVSLGDPNLKCPTPATNPLTVIERTTYHRGQSSGSPDACSQIPNWQTPIAYSNLFTRQSIYPPWNLKQGMIQHSIAQGLCHLPNKENPLQPTKRGLCRKFGRRMKTALIA